MHTHYKYIYIYILTTHTTQGQFKACVTVANGCDMNVVTTLLVKRSFTVLSCRVYLILVIMNSQGARKHGDPPISILVAFLSAPCDTDSMESMTP